METFALIIILLINNAGFNKGQTLELEYLRENKTVMTYQIVYKENGTIYASSRIDKSITPVVKVYNENNSLTIGERKQPKDDWFKAYKVVEVDNGRGYDYVDKMFIFRNGKMELVQSKVRNVSFESGEIIEKQAGEILGTYKIVKNH